MKEARLLKIIVAPHISEKASQIASTGKSYVFRVLKTASKKEISEAIEKIFSTKVRDVRTVNVRERETRFGQRKGYQKAWKKAYITLQEGSQIAMGEEQP